jgi:hypothetical protein
VRSTFINVLVEEHEALPEGCCMRFKSIGEPRAVERVLYEAEGSSSPTSWVVESMAPDGSVGTAWAVDVEDSGAGVSPLVYGGAWGLRLRSGVREEGLLAEPYLLLAADAVL